MEAKTQVSQVTKSFGQLDVDVKVEVKFLNTAFTTMTAITRDEFELASNPLLEQESAPIIIPITEHHKA